MTAKSKLIKKGEPFEVGFNAFAFAAIRRDIVERFTFKDDIGGCCNDVVFCNNCRKAGIPLIVDPKINMLHLKRSDGYYDEYYVGQKKPFMYVVEVS